MNADLGYATASDSAHGKWKGQSVPCICHMGSCHPKGRGPALLTEATRGGLKYQPAWRRGPNRRRKGQPPTVRFPCPPLAPLYLPRFGNVGHVGCYVCPGMSCELTHACLSRLVTIWAPAGAPRQGCAPPPPPPHAGLLFDIASLASAGLLFHHPLPPYGACFFPARGKPPGHRAGATAVLNTRPGPGPGPTWPRSHPLHNRAKVPPTHPCIPPGGRLALYCWNQVRSQGTFSRYVSTEPVVKADVVFST